MKNEVVASENDWTGLTSYYRDEDGNRFAVGVHDLPKFQKESENAGRKIKKIPTLKYQDRQGNDFIVPEDRVRDFFYENAANQREVAEVKTWENRAGESYDMPMWKEKGDYGLREKGFKPAEEWGADGSYRTKDFINAVNHAFTHAEDWGLVRNEDGSVDVADTAKEVGGRLGRGALAGAASIAEGLGFGLAKAGVYMAGVQSRALGSVAKLVGADKAADKLTGWQAGAYGALENAQEKTRNWVIDNVLGEAITQGGDLGRDLAGVGMKAGETYGDMRLALGALGKVGKATIPMTFGAQAVEGTIEDPAIQREGAAGSAVAVVNGVANALGMGVFGKLMHAYALKGAAKEMQKTFGKALAIAFGESVAAGFDMAAIEGANQLARGIAEVEDQGVDENGGGTNDPEKIVAMRAATNGERVERAVNALLHGTVMTLGLKAAELSPRIAYSGRGMTKAVSFDVENARREYAPKVARVAEAARALQTHGEAITKGPWFDDVKGVSTNGEVVFKDGTVYYPARADRNVTVTGADGKPSEATVKGREARIVVSDGTILNAKGEVVGKLAGGQRLARTVDTQAEAYARATDPAASGNEITIFDRNTGRAADIPTNILDLAPDSYKAYNKWLLAGNTFKAPELDADGLAFGRIVGHFRMGGDAKHAAEMALGDVASGRKTMREAADLLDQVERQMRGENPRMDARAQNSADSAEERESGVVTPTSGEVKVETTPRANGELPRETVEAAADLHELGKLDVIKTEDVDVTQIETSPTEGTGVQDGTPVKATPTEHAPIVLRLNPDTGRLEPVDGKKRIAAEKANGAKTVKAVVLHEEDGWTPENAEAVKLVGNITSGNLDAKGMVDAFGKLGIDVDTATEKVLIGQGETVEQQLANNKKRAALNVAMWGDGELKAAVTDGNLMAISDIVGRINKRTWGEGWELAQRAAFYELDGLDVTSRSRALEMMRTVQPFVQSGEINWRELGETARYYAKHYDELKAEGISVNGLPGFDLVAAKMSEDTMSRVPVETKDGEITTVGEVEAKQPHEKPDVPGVGSAFDPPEKLPGLDLQARDGELGVNVFGCSRFPDMKVSANGGLYSIEGVRPEDLMDPRNRNDYAKIFGEIFEKAAAANEQLRAEWERNGHRDANGQVTEEPPKVLVNFPRGCEKQVGFLLDWYDHSVKVDPKMQTRTNAVLGILEKSGLASGVVKDQESFDASLKERGYQELVADGMTYGWTDGTNVYLNPKFFSTRAGLNTPIHEFGHLGIIATKKVNRALYDRGIELVKQTKEWKDINDPNGPYKDYQKDSDEKKAEEILTRFIAKGGEGIDAATPKGVVAEIKKWVAAFWETLGKRIGIRDLTPEQIAKMATVEDVADAIRAEMMTGREFGTRELSLAEGDLKAKILRFAKYSKPTSKGAKAALEAAKKAWKGLSEEQKVALGRYGDTSVLKTQEARTIANGVRMLREWDARRARISKAVKDQIKRSPNEGQKKIITGSPQYYVSQVTGDVTSPFAFAIDRGLPIPRKGDRGWDAWERLTDGMKYAEKRELMRILGGEHPKRGGMDTVLSDYAQWLGISWGDGARDFEHGRGIEDFLDDILKERAKFEQWKAGDRKTRTEDEADAAAAQERRGGMTDAEFAEEDAWVRASEARRVEAERMGEQDDLSDMPDFSRAREPIMMSRGQMPALAKAKVGEWVKDTSPDSVRIAIEQKIEKGLAERDYRFKKPEDRKNLVKNAVRFYKRFSQKTIMLSDGRVVYFVPDARAKIERGLNNDEAWAEYAIHAVTSSGEKMGGKPYAERLYNRTKAANIWKLENIIKAERCEAKIDENPERDGVIFYGRGVDGKAIQIITRLDEKGNIYADLTEVTVVDAGKRKNLPPRRPLTEVVRTVANRRQRGGLLTADGDSVSQTDSSGNGIMLSRGGLYTGSAADYEKPSLLKVGTGEGSQVYGWGALRKQRARRGGMTDAEFAEEDAWVRASEARRVEAERMGEQDDLSDMPDFSRGKQPIMMNRAIGPSALGDGKQKYYEVPFEKAVDKIVKNKKAFSDDHVFISETPKPLKEIGLPALPVMMNQKHVISCYYAPGEGVKANDLHGLGEKLKMLPSALQHPIMIIASETRPHDSVISIVKMVDKNRHQIFVPVEINGVGRIGEGRVNANIVTSAYGRPNTWSEMVAHAIRNEVDGKVSVFYIDNNEASKVKTMLAREAFDFGRSEVQFLSRSRTSNVIHSIDDSGSPVKGGVTDQTQQFKDWFGKSKIVDADGKPMVVYQSSNWDPLKEPAGKGVFNTGTGKTGWGAHFGTKKAAEERSNDAGYKNIGAYYVNLRNPLKVNDTGYWTPGDTVAAIREAGIKDFPWTEDIEQIKAELRKRGYDGLMYENAVEDEGSMSYIAFEPTQIKSATDNIGTFDPTNKDIRFSRPTGVDRSLLVFGQTRVAEDAGRGEMTPGALAASRELSTQQRTPIQQAGQVRKLSLALSDMEWARKFLTGSVVPAHIAKRLPGGANSASTRSGKLVIAADLFGLIDKMDHDVNKNFLKLNGYFRNEDLGWCAGKTGMQIAAERKRSEEQLSNQLDALRKRRVEGQKPGGESAARSIFADELANIVMEMRHVPTGGTVGAVRTIGDGLRAGLLARGTPDAIRDEAGAFLDWAYGAPAAGQPATRDLPAEQLTNRMFGAYLVMPNEIEARAPQWSREINDIIASDQKLLETWRQLSRRAMSEQSFGAVERQMLAALDRQTEVLIRQMEADAKEPISAGSTKADAKEQLLVGFHDRMAPVAVRIDEKVKAYRAAKKEAMKLARTPQEKQRLASELSRFIGSVDDAVNKMKLSRLAFERGASGEGMVYFIKEKLLLDELTERQGLTLTDFALYLDHQRGIETQGRANSGGMTPRQNKLALENMKLRLGSAKYHALEVGARKWFSIHEQEFLDDPRLLKACGKDYVDYLKTQTHYVTTARTWSPEELAGIEQGRAAARRSGVAGGDDVIDSMFKFVGRNGMGTGEGLLTARLTGSFADKKNVIAATMDKVDRSLKFLRRNQYVMDLRDALLAAGVEGVRDVARGNSAFPDGKRYGHLNYLENGHKRTLVVPKQIADGFVHDQSSMRLYSKCYGAWRKSIIDWNPAYWNRNIARNSGSIEKNMPGVREGYVKTALRPFGLGNFADTMCQHLVRHAPSASRLFGDDTIFGFIPKAKRMAMIREDPSRWEQQLWRAIDAGDVEAEATLRGDLEELYKVLKTNALAPVRGAYEGKDVGFVDDVLGQKSLKTIQRIREEAANRTGRQKALDAATWVFRRNAQQQMFEDDLAKITAYLHDRAKFGGVRTEKETGLKVAENVSIGQGERSGTLKRGIQGTVATFFNMVEKGIVRNVKAHAERPGEMIAKDAKVWTGTLVGGLLSTGVISWAIRKMFDDDDDKIAESPLALPYQYAEFWRKASKNRSTYMKENCNCVPVWMSPSGKTTLDIRMPYNDEDKLIVPGAQFAAEMIAAKCGIGAEPSVMNMVKRSTLNAITPDLALAGPLWMTLRDTVWSLFSNPEDYFTGRELYDKDLHENRFESLDMFGKFSAAMGLQLWNDLGGRVIYQPNRSGIEGERSEVSPYLDVVLNKLPIASPFVKSFLSVQTGDLDKYAKPLTEAEQKRASLLRFLRKEAKKESTPDVSWFMRDSEGYRKQIDKWTETYKLTPDELEDLRNGISKDWLEMGPLEGVNDIKKKMSIQDKAREQGIDPRWITD